MKTKLLTTILLMSTVSAQAMNFKASMQALRLPVTIGLALPPDQSEAAPGEMTVGLQRMCGDGDVAHLASENPALQFVPQTMNKLDVIAGYWIVDGAEDANPVPTPGNFYPVAYIKDQPVADLPSTVKIADSFLPINHAVEDGKNGLEILAAEVINIYHNANRSFGSSKSYRLYSGVFTCLNVDDGAAMVKAKTPEFKFMPSATELSNQISHNSGIASTAYGAIKLLDKNSFKSGKVPDTIGYRFGVNSGSLLQAKADNNLVYAPLRVFFDSKSSDIKNQKDASGLKDKDITSLSSTTAYSKFEQILNLELPNPDDAPFKATPPDATAKKEDIDKFKAENPTDKERMDFINLKIDEWKNQLQIDPTLADVSAQIKYCQSLGLNVDQDAPSYRWEIFPMNAACKKLFNETEKGPGDSSSLALAYGTLTKKLSNMAELKTLTDKFWIFKRDLAARFYVANALNVFQGQLQANTDLKISHANCFNSGANPIITRLVGSYPIRYTLSGSAYTTAPNPLNHIHPEPSFAIAGWKDYAASDVMGVWGQVINQTPYYPPGAFSEVDGLSDEPMVKGFKGMKGEDYGDIGGGMDAPYTPVTSIKLPDPIAPEPINPLEWGVFLPLDQPSKLPNYKVEGNSFKGPAINILFKIRSIGGSCPGFC